MTSHFTHRIAAVAAVGALFAAMPLAAAQAAPTSNPGSQRITTAQVNATGGSVSINLKADVQTALNAFGTVTPTGLAGGSVATGLTMPVKSGRILYMQRHRKDGSVATTRILAGSLRLTGGFNVTHGSSVIAITDVVGNLWEGRSGRIEARINGSKHRYDVISLAAPTVDPVARTVSATLRLTEHGVKLVNAAAGKVVATNKMAIGTITVKLP